jgi:hypothetical protein
MTCLKSHFCFLQRPYKWYYCSNNSNDKYQYESQYYFNLFWNIYYNKLFFKYWFVFDCSVFIFCPYLFKVTTTAAAQTSISTSTTTFTTTTASTIATTVTLSCNNGTHVTLTNGSCVSREALQVSLIIFPLLSDYLFCV